MKKLRKYHATGKISYRKGVLYEVDRYSSGDDSPRRSDKNFFKKLITAIGGFVSSLFGKKGHAKRRASVKKSRRRIRLSPSDKKLYVIASCAAAAIVLCTALLTTVLIAKDKVTINDEGRITYASIVDGQTVTQLLDANNITIEKGDAVEISDDQRLTDGMEIVIHRATPVTVYADGTSHSVRLLAGTVEDVLNESGVKLGDADEVYPSLSTYITKGMSVSIVRVNVQRETKTSEIEYKEIRKLSANYPKGSEYLYQKGKKGLLEETVEIVYKNGEVFSSKVVKSTVITKAQDEIIYVGTKVEAPQTTKTPQTSKQPSSGGGSSDYGQSLPVSEGLLTKLPSISQLHSGTLSQHQSIAAPSPDLIAKTITAETTAYTWTGNRTATGTVPRIGTVAVDPKLIPYGSLLYIPGYGYARAEDTGNFRFVNNDGGYWLDLYMDSVSQCGNWGRRNVKVYILKG